MTEAKHTPTLPDLPDLKQLYHRGWGGRAYAPRRQEGRLLDGREWNEMPDLATAIQQYRSQLENADT